MNITKGIKNKPIKIVIYGPEGVGKTTFASKFPNALFIDTEDGSFFLDVSRTGRPETWNDLLNYVKLVASEKPCKTLVIDTIDWAEHLCINHVCESNKVKSIDAIPYGKGFTFVSDEIKKLLELLTDCINAGINVVVCAHAQIKKFEQPDELGAYDRWELKLTKKSAPLVKEWCDLLLFANFKSDTMKDEKTGNIKATGGKKRVMYASHTAAYDAKNRLGLPDSMPFEFSAIEGALGAVTEEKAPEPEATEKKPQADAEKPSSRAKKKPASGKQAKPIVVKEVIEPEIKQLHQLMADYGVNEVQLRSAVASRKNNPYTEENTIADYDINFIRNTLLKHWEAIVKTVHEQSDIYGDSIPF